MESDGQPPSGAAAVETHGSYVFFTADRAFKLLKPVRTPFFDYSTPALRRAACEREVRLNRRMAPDVYLGVSPVLEDGVETDCLVVMRRLPDSRRLSTLVGTPGFLDRVRQVARAVSVFHASLPPDPEAARTSTRDAVADLWTRQNLDDLDQHHADLLGAGELATVRRLATRFLAGREALFASRIAAGRAVDGHGDLLADDIFCMDDGPRILDCLAFSDDLRRGDVAADLAFLAMDLERLAGPAAMAALVDTYVEDTDDHLPAPLLHHWIAYRALVRAKVRAIRAAQGTSDDCRRAAADAVAFRDQCLDHLRAAHGAPDPGGRLTGHGQDHPGRGALGPDRGGRAVLRRGAQGAPGRPPHRPHRRRARPGHVRTGGLGPDLRRAAATGRGAAGTGVVGGARCQLVHGPGTRRGQDDGWTGRGRGGGGPLRGPGRRGGGPHPGPHGPGRRRLRRHPRAGPGVGGALRALARGPNPPPTRRLGVLPHAFRWGGPPFPVGGAVVVAGCMTCAGPRTLGAVPLIYAFDHRHRRPPMDMKDLLGGKGANLAEMASVLELPVPPGFTITTEACRRYMDDGWPRGLDAELDRHLARLEKRTGRALGDPDDPLLVSVRVRAPSSRCPG